MEAKLAKQKAIYKNLMKKAELRTYLQPYQQ
jgi:hypothetical protein